MSKGTTPGSKDSQTNDGGQDWFDGVCETATNSLCPVPQNLPGAVAENNTEDADVLDHVFERVESFSCTSPADLQKSEQQEKSQLDVSTATTVSSEKDALDYVFEKVESMVCNQEPDDDNEDIETGRFDIASIVPAHSGDGKGSQASASNESTHMQELAISPYGKDKTWYNNGFFMACVCCLLMILVALIVNLILFFTRWK